MHKNNRIEGELNDENSENAFQYDVKVFFPATKEIVKKTSLKINQSPLIAFH